MMPPILPLTLPESIKLSALMLAQVPVLSEDTRAKMAVILTWYNTALYHLGYEIAHARGEEQAPTGAEPPAYTGPARHPPGHEAGLP